MLYTNENMAVSKRPWNTFRVTSECH